MRLKGKIASWNDDKGFGFITPFDGGNRVFVHIKAFRKSGRRPDVNDELGRVAIPLSSRHLDIP